MTPLDRSAWKFHHTMLRIKDPQRSLEFYRFLGMYLIQKDSVPDAQSDRYFLGYVRSGDDPGRSFSGEDWHNREGILELVHGHGTEHDATFQVSSGNDPPWLGYGHICISVDNLEAICQQLECEGAQWGKRLKEGWNSFMAFVKDPDGYWIELLGNIPYDQVQDGNISDRSTYLVNHTALRISDLQRSLAFYQDVMGMKSLWHMDAENIGSKFHFLAYSGSADNRTYSGDLTRGQNDVVRRQGCLELRWNYGSSHPAAEPQQDSYHNGNSEPPQGFGHIGFAVDDIEKVCKMLDEKQVRWTTTRGGARESTSVWVDDPDGYRITVFQKSRSENAIPPCSH